MFDSVVDRCLRRSAMRSSFCRSVAFVPGHLFFQNRTDPLATSLRQDDISVPEKMSGLLGRVPLSKIRISSVFPLCGRLALPAAFRIGSAWPLHQLPLTIRASSAKPAFCTSRAIRALIGTNPGILSARLERSPAPLTLIPHLEHGITLIHQSYDVHHRPGPQYFAAT